MLPQIDNIDTEFTGHATGPDGLDLFLAGQPTTDQDVDRMWAEEQERLGGEQAPFSNVLDACLNRVATSLPR